MAMKKRHSNEFWKDVGPIILSKCAEVEVTATKQRF